LIVRKRLSPTRTRSSNLLAPQLLPTLSAAHLTGSDLLLEGKLLGGESDDGVLSFCRAADGLTLASIDTFEPAADQQALTVRNVSSIVPAGTYRLVLRVNNQQARSSPLVTVT
jgi:hypothetical protein